MAYCHECESKMESFPRVETKLKQGRGGKEDRITALRLELADVAMEYSDVMEDKDVFRFGEMIPLVDKMIAIAKQIKGE